jgi:hypothetical protein
MRRLMMALLLAWVSFALYDSATEAWAGWRAAPASHPPPWAWRYGTKPVRALARCTSVAQRIVPAGSLVALVTPADDFFEWRWAAYLMASHEVIGLWAPELTTRPLYVIRQGKALGSPGTPLHEDHQCGVYLLP